MSARPGRRSYTHCYLHPLLSTPTMIYRAQRTCAPDQDEGDSFCTHSHLHPLLSAPTNLYREERTCPLDQDEGADPVSTLPPQHARAAATLPLRRHLSSPRLLLTGAPSTVAVCVAVCCSVLQCIAVYCSILQCVAVCGSVRQCVAVCGSV